MSLESIETQLMPNPRKKRCDEAAAGLAVPDGQPGQRSAADSAAEHAQAGARPRPIWLPDAGHETDAGLTAMLQLYLDEKYSSDATWRHRLVEALLEQADEGNLRAIQEIWMRLEGKPGAHDPEDALALDLDPEVIAKILEAGRTDDEDPPLD